jgi:hypothetical protein
MSQMGHSRLGRVSNQARPRPLCPENRRVTASQRNDEWAMNDIGIHSPAILTSPDNENVVPVLTPPPASRQPHCELGEIAYFALDRDGTTVLQGYDLVAY